MDGFLIVVGFDDEFLAVNRHGIAGSQLAASAGFGDSVHGHCSGLNQDFGFAARLDDLSHLEELIQLDRFDIVIGRSGFSHR